MALPLAAAPLSAATAAPIAVATEPLAAQFSLKLDASHALVQSTREALPWEDVAPSGGGAVVSVLLPQHQAFVFIARCAFKNDDATRLALSTNSILTVALTASAWSRVLNELMASGLFNTHYDRWSQLLSAIRDLTITTPADLVLAASDFMFGETFDTPAVPAVPARAAAAGRRGSPARRATPAVPRVPPVPGPAVLRYISLAPLALFQDLDNKLPLLSLYMGRRLMGLSLTRASRLLPMSTSQMAASLLRPSLERHTFGGASGATDEAVSSQLPRFLLDLKLPSTLVSSELSDRAILRDLADSTRYVFGSAGDRRVVENSRLGSADG